MEITPRELRDVEIHSEIRGYSRDEVNELLERAAADDRSGERARAADAGAAQRPRSPRPVAPARPRTSSTARCCSRSAPPTKRSREATAKARQMLDDAEIQSRRLVADAEAEARRKGETERRRLEEEILELAGRRDALLADVEALTRFEAEYRERMVRALEADLTALRSRPTTAPGHASRSRATSSLPVLPKRFARPRAGRRRRRRVRDAGATAPPADVRRAERAVDAAAPSRRAAPVDAIADRRRARDRRAGATTQRSRRALAVRAVARRSADASRRRSDVDRAVVAASAGTAPPRPAPAHRGLQPIDLARRPTASTPRCSTTTRSSRRCARPCTTTRRSVPATSDDVTGETRSSTRTPTAAASATSSAAAANRTASAHSAPAQRRARPARRRSSRRRRALERLGARRSKLGREHLGRDPVAVALDGVDAASPVAS